MKVWLDDRVVPADTARIDPRDRGLLLGDGLFETFAARAGRVFRLAAHLRRLRDGAAVLGIPVPLDDAGIAAAVAATLAANGLDDGDASVRVTLTRGPGPRGLVPPEAPEPTLMVAAAPAAPPPGPARAVIAGPRRNEHSPTARLKTLGYLDNVLARREAAAGGADEALMRNGAGALACASAANLFVVEGGALVTPGPDQGVLPGVTRATVIELAAARGVAVRETAVAPGRLAAAAEAFLTNSLIGVRPLVAVDGAAVGAGEPGPLTRALRDAYAAAVASEGR